MTKKTSLFILIAVSLAIHFAFFGHPNEIVFDEVHFGKFISAYYTQEYYFDIHPPGGKLIIAGFAKLFNFSPEYDFAQIGGEFTDSKYLILRFLPLLAGMLLPLVIFFLVLELGLSRIAALSTGLIISLENALLTQSRYILLDPFLLLFGFSTLLFYLKWKRTNKMSDLILIGIFGGLAASIKWTGLSFLALSLGIESVQNFRTLNIKRIGYLAIHFVLIPLVIYFSIFAIHFSILTFSGEGDAFMSLQFQKTLKGSLYNTDENIESSNLVEKFVELNKEMYDANQTLTASHPYSSKWYTWPFMIRPIYYWNQSSSTEPKESKIYLIGNPFIWWSSTVALLYLIASSLNKSFFKDKVLLIIVGGFLLNFIPFIAIGRVMFLYHYLAALIFSILALVYCIDSQPQAKRIFSGFVLVAALIFIWFAPLSYGLPLEAGSFENRIWLNTWR